MNKSEIASEALSRALANLSTSNYGPIFDGFALMGIEDIQPRVNVFTYHAWRAKGRQVRKGEHGVKIVTYIEVTKKGESGEDSESFRRPKSTTVFHITQTDTKGE